MTKLKPKTGTGNYIRKIRLNKYINCGDYSELITTDKNGIENARFKIDNDDLEKVKIGKWSLLGGKKGVKKVPYAIRYINGKVVLLHQYIFGKKKGYWIDHINGDSFDTRKSNLRFVTPQQSCCNRSNMKGFYVPSYYKNKIEKKWVSHIIYKNEFHYLGIFNTENEAKKVREEAEIKFFGEHRRKKPR